MGATEPVPIELLTVADAPGGLALSEEAGWNQNEADWRFVLAAGSVAGVRAPDGRLVASAALLPYGTAPGFLPSNRAIASDCSAPDPSPSGQGESAQPTGVGCSPAGPGPRASGSALPRFEALPPLGPPLAGSDRRASGDRGGTSSSAGQMARLPTAGAGAWISLVLVTADFRRRGLATALMRWCLARADTAGLATFLDATPAGAEVYRPLGFRPVSELVRLRRPPLVAASAAAAPEIGTLADLARLDRAALGLDRFRLLADLAGRPGSRIAGRGGDVCLMRQGRNARQLGPAYGSEAEEAEDLVSAVAAAEPGELVIDVYAGQTAFLDRLQGLGFVHERPFLRMVRGPEQTPAGDPDLALASAGPEYG